MSDFEDRPWLKPASTKASAAPASAPRPPADPAAGPLLRACPVLGVRTIAEASAFYLDGLGFEPVAAGEDYAILQREEAELHLARMSASGLKPSSVYFRVRDADALYAEWLRRPRVTLAGAPSDRPWGAREFHLFDPDGNLLRFGQTLGT